MVVPKVFGFEILKYDSKPTQDFISIYNSYQNLGLAFLQALAK
jgi:hypothetical protein